jgi:putative ATP-binding cassette transporter
MELVRFLLARSRRTLVLTIVFGLVSGATNAGMLAVVNIALFRPAGRMPALVLIFVGLCAIAPLTRVISELLLMRLGQNAILALRMDLSRQVLAVPLRNLEQAGVHRILSVLTDDIPNLTGMVAMVPMLCINTGVVASCLAYMGWLQWQLLAALLGFMLLGTISYRLGVSRATPHFRKARETENLLHKHFQGLLHGMKELKVHRRRREAFLSSVLGSTSELFRSETLSGLSIYTVAASWGQLLIFVVIGLAVFLLRGTLGLSTGVLTGFTLALLYLMNPLQMVMNAAPGLLRAKLAIRNIRELGLTLTNSASVEEKTELQIPSGSLSLQNVSYAYRHEDSSEEFTLGPLDLTIEPGELLFITGGNGSGKTTLAKLIVGLYAPQTGELRYNGHLISDSNRDSYRQNFSVVFSDFFLFESLLGLEGEHLDARAREYLAGLRLEHKVRVENGVFSTLDLSQGQRKRLALLTACMEDRQICFFDEWAADQDPVFKEVFYHSILPGLKAQGKTVIVISHDDRYYQVADRIISLESGRLAHGLPAFLAHAAEN